MEDEIRQLKAQNDEWERKFDAKEAELNSLREKYEK